MRTLVALGVAGIVLGLAGNMGFGILENRVRMTLEEGIYEQVVWRQNSSAQVHARYRGDSTPSVTTKIWFLSVANVDEVRAGDKPMVTEVGPFVYRKRLTRQSPVWSNATFPSTVSFTERTFYEFVPGQGPPPDTEITTLNFPLAGALAQIAARAPTGSQTVLSWLASLVEGWGDDRVQGSFVRRTAKELLWGYEDPLLKAVARFAPGVRLEPRFALLKNGTESDEERVMTNGDCGKDPKARSGSWSWWGKEEGEGDQGPALCGRHIASVGENPAGQSPAGSTSILPWLRLVPVAQRSLRRVARDVARLCAGVRRALNPWLPVPAGSGTSRTSGNFAGSLADEEDEPLASDALFDPDLVWQVAQWKGLREVRCWGKGHVEAVAGGDGSQFGPGLALDSLNHVWAGQLFRGMHLRAGEEVAVDMDEGWEEEDGMDGKSLQEEREQESRVFAVEPPLEFDVAADARPNAPKPLPRRLASPSPPSLSNAHHPPLAAHKKKKGGKQRPTSEPLALLRLRPDPADLLPQPRYFQNLRGLLNVTTPAAAGPSQDCAAGGPPIFFSGPHFCGADPSLPAAIGGLDCDPERHATHLDAEPLTGLTLRAQRRTQLSSAVGRPWAAVDAEVRDAVLPVFWVEEASAASAASLRRFERLVRGRRALSALREVASPASAACIVLGSALLAVGLAGTVGAPALHGSARRPRPGARIEPGRQTQAPASPEQGAERGLGERLEQPLLAR